MADPVNISSVGISPEAIGRDAAYGVNMATAYQTWLNNHAARPIDGLRILEIGPGINYAGAIGMAA